jgi:hypothetical protein
MCCSPPVWLCHTSHRKVIAEVRLITMKSGLLTCLVFLSSAASAQSPPAAGVAPGGVATGGVASEWDVRKLLDSLDLQAQHVKPIIDQVKPETWVAKGAPKAYVTQWTTAQAELKYLLGSSEALAKQPERLTLALETYFRMQALESTLSSVTEGIRKYQNPALADLMQSVVAENSSNADKLRQYVQDLATQKEQEFQVADKEAQRCRESLVKQPAAPSKAVRK